ncbi:amidase family protein [Cupriavidus sp. UYPR2.512]|uniref:amidase family protein n=1 Tax=Cupriavidus sp. UYPR2.512 TaxID=1080187 RepID=UPI00039ECFDF|nr:amidase family protein [Cupriavidus sp. UYPR2.512]
MANARQVDAHSNGALKGLPIGVKDLMDTATMPTTYGSPIYEDFRPRMHAAAVALAKSAGAVVLGKTVSTEFAAYWPGPTRNPRAPGDAPPAHQVGLQVAYFVGVLSRNAELANATQHPHAPIRVGICRTPHWNRASADSRFALEQAASRYECHRRAQLHQRLP